MSKHKWKGAIIHHIGGMHTLDQSKLWYDSVRNYHMKHLGWRQIGYHFFIEADGTIIATKRWNLSDGPLTKNYGYPESENQLDGAHCTQKVSRDGKIDLTKSANKCMIGVCLAGNFDVQRPTKDQLLASKGLLDWLKSEVIEDPCAIYKHSQFAEKSCPALNNEEWAYITGQLWEETESKEQ